MKLVRQVIIMANKNHHPLRAAWRNLTYKQMKELPVSQKDAYDKDSLYYFTDKPCKYGHIAPKTRCNKYCVICKYNKEKKIPAVKIEVEKPEPILVLGMKINGLLNKNKD